jgi:DNA repair protein RecN (Recombination protein N)
MLVGLTIRDVVLIEALDLAIGPGLTALTGETGAGKSIVLDALGLATGARADAGLVRRGAAQSVATAMFAPAADHPVWTLLDDKGLAFQRDEDLVLRRQVAADGRSRAYVNDQATGVGVLRELGALLLEVHGQHETVGLLDSRTHRALLDAFGGLQPGAAACAAAWREWRQRRAAAEDLRTRTERAAADAEELAARLADLDRLSPRADEEAALSEERALLSAGEKVRADIESAREHVVGAGRSGSLATRLSQGLRALERARERAVQSGASPDGGAALALLEAAGAVERAMLEAEEAVNAVERAAAAFDFEPERLGAHRGASVRPSRRRSPPRGRGRRAAGDPRRHRRPAARRRVGRRRPA